MQEPTTWFKLFDHPKYHMIFVRCLHYHEIYLDATCTGKGPKDTLNYIYDSHTIIVQGSVG